MKMYKFAYILHLFLNFFLQSWKPNLQWKNGHFLKLLQHKQFWNNAKSSRTKFVLHSSISILIQVLLTENNTYYS